MLGKWSRPPLLVVGEIGDSVTDSGDVAKKPSISLVFGVGGDARILKKWGLSGASAQKGGIFMLQTRVTVVVEWGLRPNREVKQG